jgi:hypothetical protein
MLTHDTVVYALGKTFADTLDSHFVTLLGRDWTRREVVEELRLANMTAVRRLENNLKKLKVTTAERLAEIDPFSLFRMKGIGDAQLFVAMSLLDAYGYDPISWWDEFDVKSKVKAKRRKTEEVDESNVVDFKRSPRRA